jgi:hypothetical protein
MTPNILIHSGQMKRAFSELSPEELRGLEVTLKKVGKRAAALTRGELSADVRVRKDADTARV